MRFYILSISIFIFLFFCPLYSSHPVSVKSAEKSATEHNVAPVNVSKKSLKNPNIFGGTTASKDATKSLAFIQIGTAGGTGRCTGVAIETNKILTAAHCFLTSEPPFKPIAENVEVWVGLSLTLSKYLQASLKVKYVDIHRDYLSYSTADLAVITLTSDVIPSSSVAAFSSLLKSRRDGDIMTIAGYGITGGTRDEPEFSVFPQQLKQRFVQRLTLPGRYFELTSEYGEGPCGGDSGGPVFYINPFVDKMFIYGIHFSGPPICGKGGLSYQVNTAFYRDSIEDIIEEEFDDWIQVFPICSESYCL